jgi:hypothetical protein
MNRVLLPVQEPVKSVQSMAHSLANNKSVQILKDAEAGGYGVLAIVIYNVRWQDHPSAKR